MSNISRLYYERELGAGYGPHPTLKEAFGYSEPLRRFIQRESFEPQANEIRNTMPSWLPGDDYMTNFRVGDPYVRVDDGYARLPGAGYEALHPELKGIDPEEYPDIHKLRILADVAPYSREYNTFRQKVAGDAKYDTGLEIELEKIIDRVRQTKESSIRMDHQVFLSCRPTKTSRARAERDSHVFQRITPAYTVEPILSLLTPDCFAALLSRRPQKPSRACADGIRHFSRGARVSAEDIRRTFAGHRCRSWPERFRDRVLSGAHLRHGLACSLVRVFAGSQACVVQIVVVVFGAEQVEGDCRA